MITTPPPIGNLKRCPYCGASPMLELNHHTQRMFYYCNGHLTGAEAGNYTVAAFHWHTAVDNARKVHNE